MGMNHGRYFFVAFVEDNTIMSLYCILKILYPICAKPKEVDPIKLHFSMTNKYFDSTRIINNQVPVLDTLDYGMDHKNTILFIENILNRKRNIAILIIP